jgi:hypothetical protein
MSINKTNNDPALRQIDSFLSAQEVASGVAESRRADNRHFVLHQALSTRARRLLEPTREFNQQVFKKFLNDWSQVFQRAQPSRPYALPVTMAK